jgi:NADH-quinone oxidoreductase subunit E
MNSKKILNEFEPKRENLLPILQSLQDNHPQNYLPPETLKEVSKYLNLTLSQVYGVVGYYSMLSTKPRGKHIIRICNSPVCHMCGAENAIEWLKEILRVNLNETTSDGIFTIEESECLGRCGKAPSMMINKEFYGELTKAKIEQIIRSLRENVAHS